MFLDGGGRRGVLKGNTALKWVKNCTCSCSKILVICAFIVNNNLVVVLSLTVDLIAIYLISFSDILGMRQIYSCRGTWELKTDAVSETNIILK